MMLNEMKLKSGVPYGIRTRVAAVKGQCPRPLDEGDVFALYLNSAFESRISFHELLIFSCYSFQHGVKYKELTHEIHSSDMEYLDNQSSSYTGCGPL